MTPRQNVRSRRSVSSGMAEGVVVLLPAEKGRGDFDRTLGSRHLLEDAADDLVEVGWRMVAQIEHCADMLGPDHQPIAVPSILRRQPLEETYEQRGAGKAVISHVRVTGIGMKDDGLIAAALLLVLRYDHLARCV